MNKTKTTNQDNFPPNKFYGFYKGIPVYTNTVIEKDVIYLINDNDFSSDRGVTDHAKRVVSNAK